MFVNVTGRGNLLAAQLNLNRLDSFAESLVPPCFVQNDASMQGRMENGSVIDLIPVGSRLYIYATDFQLNII